MCDTFSAIRKEEMIYDDRWSTVASWCHTNPSASTCHMDRERVSLLITNTRYGCPKKWIYGYSEPICIDNHDYQRILEYVQVHTQNTHVTWAFTTFSALLPNLMHNNQRRWCDQSQMEVRSTWYRTTQIKDDKQELLFIPKWQHMAKIIILSDRWCESHKNCTHSWVIVQDTLTALLCICISLLNISPNPIKDSRLEYTSILP